MFRVENEFGIILVPSRDGSFDSEGSFFEPDLLKKQIGHQLTRRIGILMWCVLLAQRADPRHLDYRSAA